MPLIGRVLVTDYLRAILVRAKFIPSPSGPHPLSLDIDRGHSNSHPHALPSTATATQTSTAALDKQQQLPNTHLRFELLNGELWLLVLLYHTLPTLQQLKINCYS